MIQFAWLMLMIWPIITIVLFRKYSMPVAICATIIGGYLLLPTREGLDLPLLPKFSKHSIPALSALFMTAIMLKDKPANIVALDGWMPRNVLVNVLLAVLVIGAFGTAFTNGDALFFGPRVLPGIKIYDAFSVILQAMVFLIPMFLARRLLSSVQGQRVLLTSLVIAALGYSMLTLWETRMSPQLNVHVYGFFPHSFLQHVRAGGFRPIVFLSHGLQIGIFFAMATLGAVALFRTAPAKNRMKWALAAGWLFISLILAKTIGALLIATILLPVALFFRPRTQLLVAACIAGTFITFPVLRAAGAIPVEQISDLAAQFSAERASSLNIRLVNEDALLARAQERPIFGWGGYSRNRIFDELGRNISVTDGLWTIQLGVGGWFRYIAIFGMLMWPIVGLFIAKRDRIDPVCAVLALMLAANLLDLIPNSALTSLAWLIAGSLLGRIEMRLGAEQEDQSELLPDQPSRMGYTRFPGKTPKKRPERIPQSRTRTSRNAQKTLRTRSR